MNQKAIVYYLTEIRKRLITSLIFLAILFLFTLYFANDLYTWLAIPLLKQLPQQHLIATNLISAFFIPFEFAFYIAIFLSMPFFLYQIWAFVAPALYPTEKRAIWPLMIGTLLLFYLGTLFAYFIIFPVLFAFLTHSAPQGVLVMPDMSQYLEMTLRLFLIFGAMFEVPIVIIFLNKSKIVSKEKLIRIRPYIIIASFVMGMLIAPPDVLSQTLIALPLWALYELGVLLLHFIGIEHGQGRNTRN